MIQVSPLSPLAFFVFLLAFIFGIWASSPAWLRCVHILLLVQHKILTFCLISQKAYHLGQEETDWFEKPREARGDRSRHHGTGSHSSSGRRGNVKHTYHDYDEPPEEDLWPQDEYGHQRHSSSSRDHRHHGNTSGRHSTSRHASDDPRSSRSSRSHPKDPSRSDGRVSTSSSQKRSSDPRSAGHRDSGDYSRDPSGHHHGSTGQRGQRQPGSSRRQEPSSGSRQQHGEHQASSQHEQQRSTAGQQASAKQTGPQPPEAAQQGQGQQGQTTRTQQQPQQQPAVTMGATQPTTTVPGTGTGTTQQQAKPGQAPTQTRQQPGGPPTAQPAAAMVSFHSA